MAIRENTQPPPLPNPIGAKGTNIFTSQWARRSLFLCCLVVAAVIGHAAWDYLSREDTAEDYAIMGELLMAGTRLEDGPTIELTAAEVEVKLEEVKETANLLAKRSRMLAPLARDFSTQMAEIEDIQKNMPDRGKLLMGLAQFGLGCYVRELGLISEGGQKAIKETETLIAGMDRMKKVFHEKQVLALKLSKIGEKWKGPATNQVLVSYSYEFDSGGLLGTPTGTIHLENTSGLDLNNCIVGVRLMNSAGNSYLRFHFIRHWQKGERRLAKYEENGFDEPLVHDANRVQVEAWSDEVSGRGSFREKSFFGWGEAKEL